MASAVARQRGPPTGTAAAAGIGAEEEAVEVMRWAVDDLGLGLAGEMKLQMAAPAPRTAPEERGRPGCGAVHLRNRVS
jgi:hypothetical protein